MKIKLQGHEITKDIYQKKKNKQTKNKTKNKQKQTKTNKNKNKNKTHDWRLVGETEFPYLEYSPWLNYLKNWKISTHWLYKL